MSNDETELRIAEAEQRGEERAAQAAETILRAFGDDMRDSIAAAEQRGEARAEEALLRLLNAAGVGVRIDVAPLAAVRALVADRDRCADERDELIAWVKACADGLFPKGAAEASPLHAEVLSHFMRVWQRGRTAAIDEARGLDTDTRVRFYEHDFYPLSNFSAFSIQWKGFRFDTSEHAYHWEKFSGTDYRELLDKIRTAVSAHEAFKLAEKHRAWRRPDWDAVKVDIMRDILFAKVDQHEYVRRKLLATGERELVEDSWRDGFWGWGPNRDGQNMLGKLWMEIRTAVRNGKV